MQSSVKPLAKKRQLSYFFSSYFLIREVGRPRPCQKLYNLDAEKQGVALVSINGWNNANALQRKWMADWWLWPLTQYHSVLTLSVYTRRTRDAAGRKKKVFPRINQRNTGYISKREINITMANDFPKHTFQPKVQAAEGPSHINQHPLTNQGSLGVSRSVIQQCLIINMKANKAPGPGTVQGEWIKWLNQENCKKLLEFYNHILHGMDDKASICKMGDPTRWEKKIYIYMDQLPPCKLSIKSLPRLSKSESQMPSAGKSRPLKLSSLRTALWETKVPPYAHTTQLGKSFG